MTSNTNAPDLRPVSRRSLSNAIFAQIRDLIVSGAMAPGSPLPSERVLCEELGVNRGAVREALRRLEQARLVSIRHGGTSRILDYRTSAGLDLLVDLILSPSGEIEVDVVRSLFEMRSAIAPDVARLAANRGGAAVAEALHEIVTQMGKTDELEQLQILSHEFWRLLVSASGNLAYELSFNSLRDAYGRSWEAMRQILSGELTALADFTALATAVSTGDEDLASNHARKIVKLGETQLARAMNRMDSNRTPPTEDAK